MTAGDKVNLCTAVIHVSPEAFGKDNIRVEYRCEKLGLSVRACSHYKPMGMAGGEKCYGECEYYNYGCTKAKARKEAYKRAKDIIAKRMLRRNCLAGKY